jgi:nucleoside-diphosphate-sugar epimerase
MKVLITGSGGLIGSECARLLCEEGWSVVGVDNDMRSHFFGPAGSSRTLSLHFRSIAMWTSISGGGLPFGICSEPNGRIS